MSEPVSITLRDAELRAAASEGMDAFIQLFVDKMKAAVGGELNADALARLSGEQITLWAYVVLRDEVMDGGFIQLIHNGYADFFFRNPFAKVMRLWDVKELAKLVNKAKTLYARHGEALVRPCTDEEFMALFEQYPDFDAVDDEFVEQEEEFTAAVARYVDGHIDSFATVVA